MMTEHSAQSIILPFQLLPAKIEGINEGWAEKNKFKMYQVNSTLATKKLIDVIKAGRDMHNSIATVVLEKFTERMRKLAVELGLTNEAGEQIKTLDQLMDRFLDRHKGDNVNVYLKRAIAVVATIKGNKGRRDWIVNAIKAIGRSHGWLFVQEKNKKRECSIEQIAQRVLNDKYLQRIRRTIRKFQHEIFFRKKDIPRSDSRWLKFGDIEYLLLKKDACKDDSSFTQTIDKMAESKSYEEIMEEIGEKVKKCLDGEVSTSCVCVFTIIYIHHSYSLTSHKYIYTYIISGNYGTYA